MSHPKKGSSVIQEAPHHGRVPLVAASTLTNILEESGVKDKGLILLEVLIRNYLCLRRILKCLKSQIET